MVCKNCGSTVEENVKFCPECGAPMEAAEEAVKAVAEDVYSEPEQTYSSPQQNDYVSPQPAAAAPPPASQVYPQSVKPETTPELEERSKKTLTMGFLAIVFGSTFFLSFLGIIFGAIGIGRANAFKRAAGIIYGRAKVGHKLSIAGLVLGIVLTVLFVIWLVFIVFAAVYVTRKYGVPDPSTWSWSFSL